jgi:hypothetical protein
MTKDEALRLALDALECWQRNEDCNEPMSKIMGAIKAALEAKDEPVAWPCLIANADFDKDTVTLVMQCSDYKVSAGMHWLLTTPPQRTWVGLTDEEIEQGCKESWVTEQAFQSAVWWAEAKLKEKNT